MSKKDYERAAEIIRKYRKHNEDKRDRFATEILELKFVEFFNGDPRFDAERFLNACRRVEGK